MMLDTLPVETLRRIISFLPCESALTLQKTNRRLHRVSHDRQVFKSIIANRNGRGGTAWTRVPLTLESSIEDWARYALADSVARRLMEGEDESMVEKVEEWLPHLMFCHHPVVEEDHFSTTTWNLMPRTVGHDYEDYAKAVCIVLKLLSQTPVLHFTIAERSEGDSSTLFCERTAQRVLLGQLWEPIPDSRNGEHSRLYEKIKTLLALGTLARYIRTEVSRDSGYERPPAVPAALEFQGLRATGIPLAESIPFHNQLELPSPFKPCTSEHLPYCHLRIMTSRSFFETGDWVGYYSIHMRDGVSQRVDPPMLGVQFKVTAAIDANENEAWKLEGVGKDSVGDFELRGILNQDDGLLTMVKQYTSGREPGLGWNWRGFMTPFGLVGYWGTKRWGGFFWLWKEDWTPTCEGY